MSAPPSIEDHIAEHIPWEHLTITAPHDRRRLWYGIAAGLVILSLGVVVFRSLDPRSASFVPVVPAAASPAAASPAAASPDTATPSSPTSIGGLTPVAAPATPALLSEADLRSVDPLQVERVIAGYAEWITLEFFSLDPG